MSKRELKTQKDFEAKLARNLERPPIRELLKKLIAEDPEAVREIGEATGHDAVAYIRELRGKGDDDL